MAFGSTVTTDSNTIDVPVCAAAPTLTLRKTWAPNSNAGDTATVTSAGFVKNASSGLSTATLDGNTTTGVPVTVNADETGTISEAFGGGVAANYTKTLACTGNANALEGNLLTVNAADVAIVCTETNTLIAAPPPKTLTLRKIWAVNSIAGNTVTVTSAGFVNNASSGLSTATSDGNTTTGVPVTVNADETGTISEAFGGGVAANYTKTLACTGNANALEGNLLTVNAADVAIVCTETNTLNAGVCPVITLTPATLPPITVGTAYSQTITVVGGGSRAYDFAVTPALPAGLALTGATNTTVNITGTPTTAGPFSFKITATDRLDPSCFANITYAAAAVVPAGGPTLDSLGLTILVLLLAVAGVFLVNRFTV